MKQVPVTGMKVTINSFRNPFKTTFAIKMNRLWPSEIQHLQGREEQWVYTNHPPPTAPSPILLVLLLVVSVTQVQPWSKNIKWKKFKNKQFTSFKLHAILSSVIKSRTVQLCPAWDVNHLFVQCFLPVSHLVAFSVIRSTIRVLQSSCSSNPYFI